MFRETWLGGINQTEQTSLLQQRFYGGSLEDWLCTHSCTQTVVTLASVTPIGTFVGEFHRSMILDMLCPHEVDEELGGVCARHRHYLNRFCQHQLFLNVVPPGCVYT